MQNNFKTVNTWDELSESDKHFLEEWIIYRHTSSADVTDAHRQEALEHYNAVGVAIEGGKVYELGFDGGTLMDWWEYRDSDEELLKEVNEADEYYGHGVFDSVEELKLLGEYMQTGDYMGVLFT